MNWLLRQLPGIFTTITHAGAQYVEEDQLRRLILGNFVAIFGVIFTAGYALFYVLQGWWLVATFSGLMIVSYAFCWLLNTLGWFRLSPYWLLLTAYSQLTIVPGFLVGPESGIHYFLFFAGPYSFLTLPANYRLQKALFVTLGMLCFACVEYVALSGAWRAPVNELTMTWLHVSSIISTILLLAGMVWIYDSELSRAKVALEIEHQRSESLLLNILPGPIATRLKNEPGTIANDIPNASVLFADIVSFTELSARTSADELVGLLNEYFTAFDQLVDGHTVEKIKTIGDSYMVASGVPAPCEEHAKILVEFAQAMLHTVEQINHATGRSLQLRVGIHSGAVMAGVIGQRKFVYDLWGDTVNTASRMESHGLPGRIQISQDTYELAKQHYQFEPRAPLSVKGKGIMQLYLLA